MLFHSVFVLATAALAVASPTPKRRAGHVVHEKRSTVPRGWSKREEVNGNAVLPLRFGLKQRNLDRGFEFLDSVSNPTSSKYAEHWTAKEVVDMFAPSEETISSVMSWLAEFGFAPERLSLSPSKAWISVNATVAEAESLLDTKYHIYEHSSGQPHVACESYSIPSHLSEHHVDLVMPTVHFDAQVAGRGRKFKREGDGPAKSVGMPGSPSLPKFGKTIGPASIISELENCDQMITPDCLRVLYSFPPNFAAAKGNSYGIVEYTPQAYRPEDLDMFFSNFSKELVGHRPIFDSIDGGVVQQTEASFDVNGESDLDLQYAMTLVYPQTVTLYQTGDLVEGASFNNFLDAVDGSYCTFEGGDDPNQDGIYPDPAGDGYEGPESCGTFKPTNVVSTSYGGDEVGFTPFYAMRQCNEYMKLGLMGVTVLYSSGDSGVQGGGGECLGPDGTTVNGTFGGDFVPGFPSGCPWITSVGATQVPNNTNIVAELATGTQPEIACETVIFSGGGFSNIFGMPSYQKSAVEHYLTAYPPPYPPGTFNTSGSRAYPDVSANGAWYVIAVDGEFEAVFGTSCSSPTFGSVVTLINEARLAVGKKPVGFLNPTLYAHPEVLNDVTKGNNPGCNTNGFSAAPGWDPVTGLGTPNFVKMLALFLSLP